jgi:hypothetical protein
MELHLQFLTFMALLLKKAIIAILPEREVSKRVVEREAGQEMGISLLATRRMSSTGGVMHLINYLIHHLIDYHAL